MTLYLGGAPQNVSADLTTVEGYTDSLESVIGALNTSAATGAVTSTDTIMAYLKQLVGLRPAMMSFTGNSAKVTVPVTGADLDFPNVVVQNIPTGATILYADATLIVGSTLDSSGSENQIKTGTTDAIYVKVSTGSWGTDDISAIPVDALSYETPASDYGGGGITGGNTDIKSVISGNGTYNFRSEETNRTKGVEATGASLELHTVNIIVRVFFY